MNDRTTLIDKIMHMFLLDPYNNHDDIAFDASHLFPARPTPYCMQGVEQGYVEVMIMEVVLEQILHQSHRCTCSNMYIQTNQTLPTPRPIGTTARMPRAGALSRLPAPTPEAFGLRHIARPIAMAARAPAQA